MLMIRPARLALLLMLMSFPVVSASSPGERMAGTRLMIQLEIDGVIGPATVDYIDRNMKKAVSDQAVAVLIRMDTPGGLDNSMRSIIKRIIASPIPIITYVAPGGARAASAGTYILYASHVAAMAPATNLGAATPVQIGAFKGGDEKDRSDDKDRAAPLSNPMKYKMVNDAAAYIRGLAIMRGRNPQWAEQAVRKAVSVSAEEALKLNVIEIVAVDVSDLLRQLHGRKINVHEQEIRLNTQDVVVRQVRPDWRSEFLAVITNPSIAYILLMIGIYGLVFEFSNPGSVAPGTIGGISLLLALYALQLLPVNYAGVGLILFGIALMVTEAFVPSVGVLGFGGVVAFVIGSVILMDTDIPGFGIDPGLIAGFALGSAVFFIMAIGLLVKSRHSPVVSGREEMIGRIGTVIEDINGTGRGRVRVHSEIWQASSDKFIQKNEKIVVKAINGLLLQVIPFNEQEKG